MAKNLVIKYTWHDLFKGVPFKKNLLLFDNIYINNLDDVIKMGNGLSVPKSPNDEQKIRESLSSIDYLLQKGILHNYKYEILTDKEDPDLIELETQRKEFTRQFNAKVTSLKEFDAIGASKPAFRLSEIYLRMEAIHLSKKYGEDFFPLVKEFYSFADSNKKNTVVSFVLKNLPEPDDSTSWEKIIDFRSDEDTRLKYLALINWINEIAKSNFSPAEIKDKYEYLYLDYKRSYERHKIKSTLSALEIVVAAGTAFFTHNVPLSLSLASNLLNIGTTTMNLLKEEGNLPGKEIAYIYHVNKEFYG